MPKTDVTEERGLSRLQGIDLREHADQNVAHDCVNLRLDNASRITNYFRPTKVKSGSFTFACESKNPSLQEFDFSLDGYFGIPSVTAQTSEADGTKVKISGTNLKLIDKIVLENSDGTVVVSGQDFGYEVNSNGDLILDVYFSSYGSFEKLILVNSYGTYTINVDITERDNNILVFGNTFKMGIDSSSLEFCIWKYSQSLQKWEVISAWQNLSAESWTESADREVNVEFFAVQDEHGAFSFVPSFNTTNQSLNLTYYEGVPDTWQTAAFADMVQIFGYATTGYSADFSTPFAAYEGRYNFGKYDSYRLVINNGTLALQQRDTLEGDTYTTLQEWTYEQ